ncbi:hypothetical protein AVEN_237662-1 [Araneus ventricosus]|uniref:DUF4817 domain-containing protein n=1 Tax=Araneus ventricosus TaxID=182803 RepID=A0A4Y2KBX6_ARAVE|nr:hypothetical protein AVEN_237662-1 [Araneus ventricosus]
MDTGDKEISDLDGEEEYVPTESNNSDDESEISSQHDSECHESNSSDNECSEINPQASINDVRVSLCSKRYENAKAVQREWQEEFHNKNWPDKRAAVHTIDCDGWSHVMDGFQKRITDVLVKEDGRFEPIYQ